MHGAQKQIRTKRKHPQVIHSPNLRTLDLDQTELGDKGVKDVFVWPVCCGRTLPLRNIYLNAIGMGSSACSALSYYLMMPYCTLESIYMSCNPVRNAGASHLAHGLASNKSLTRLSMTSCGLKSSGAEQIVTALKDHPRLETLIIGQSYATEDLHARYNWIGDETVPSIKALIKESKTLRMLDLGQSSPVLSAYDSFVPFQ